MPTHVAGTASILVVGVHHREMEALLKRGAYVVLRAATGKEALEQARAGSPDLVVLAETLPDMTAADASRLLYHHGNMSYSVPILVAVPSQATPEQRVKALGSGVWDFVPATNDTRALDLTLRTYLEAKRNLDFALAEGLSEQMTRLYRRPGLGRRARELGALMARMGGALGCVVLALDGDLVEARAGSVLAASTRIYDVVGLWSPHEIVVISPGTGPAGAVQLARRLAPVLIGAMGTGRVVPGATLRAGYEAVSNLRYSPLDPVELLARATRAVAVGVPDPDYAWIRRFDADSAAASPMLTFAGSRTGLDDRSAP